MKAMKKVAATAVKAHEAKMHKGAKQMAKNGETAKMPKFMDRAGAKVVKQGRR